MCAGDLTAYDVLINVTQQIAMCAPFLPSHALKPENKVISSISKRLPSYDTSLSTLSGWLQKTEHQ
jgi:hypothetical protein